ncbi:hypothetical protein T12_51 [Trichinella patagoniensis]|uniref:Uncharacterized protein n=1 Tax=Trichinella patagoniensis TaxID=990121 RepID=A0A0V0YTB1_9BILA|nr:hypothetical protein T12_51 [Trichinella patagoniensis]
MSKNFSIPKFNYRRSRPFILHVRVFLPWNFPEPISFS